MIRYRWIMESGFSLKEDELKSQAHCQKIDIVRSRNDGCCLREVQDPRGDYLNLKRLWGISCGSGQDRRLMKGCKPGMVWRDSGVSWSYIYKKIYAQKIWDTILVEREIMVALLSYVENDKQNLMDGLVYSWTLCSNGKVYYDWLGPSRLVRKFNWEGARRFNELVLSSPGVGCLM